MDKLEKLHNALVFARDTGILLGLLTIGMLLLAVFTQQEFARNLFCLCFGAFLSNWARSS